MTHVFLSYSRKDFWIMRLVATFLRQENYNVWVDEKLEPGTKGWREILQQVIKEAGCIVVVLSPDAAKSEWIEEEIHSARELEIPIVPVLALGDPIDVIPLGLKRIQYIDIRDSYEVTLPKLSQIVDKYVQKKQKQAQEFALDKLGSLFWFASDCRLIRASLVPEEATAKVIREVLLQVQHHAKRLNIREMDIKRLDKIVADTENYTDENWDTLRRFQVESEIKSIFRSVSQILENLDQDFDPGPKWKLSPPNNPV